MARKGATIAEWSKSGHTPDPSPTIAYTWTQKYAIRSDGKVLKSYTTKHDEAPFGSTYLQSHNYGWKLTTRKVPANDQGIAQIDALLIPKGFKRI